MARGQYGPCVATRTVATLYVYDLATRVLSTVAAPTSHGPAGLFWSNVAEGGRAIMVGAHGETVAAARDPQSGTYYGSASDLPSHIAHDADRCGSSDALAPAGCRWANDAKLADALSAILRDELRPRQRFYAITPSCHSFVLAVVIAYVASAYSPLLRCVLPNQAHGRQRLLPPITPSESIVLTQRDAESRGFQLIDTTDAYDEERLRAAALHAAASAAQLARAGRPAAAPAPSAAYLVWELQELARTDTFEGLWPAVRAALAGGAAGAGPVALAPPWPPLEAALAALVPAQLAAWGDLASGAVIDAAYVRPRQRPEQLALPRLMSPGPLVCLRVHLSEREPSPTYGRWHWPPSTRRCAGHPARLCQVRPHVAVPS